MKYYEFRNRMGITIIISNLLLFGLILLAYSVKGFIDEEMPELFKLFLPLKTLYLTSVIKFVISNRHPPVNEEPIPVTVYYKWTVRALIYSHFIFLATTIICAATNIFAPDQLATYLFWIEAIYSGFIGWIIADMYGEKSIN